MFSCPLLRLGDRKYADGRTDGRRRLNFIENITVARVMELNDEAMKTAVCNLCLKQITRMIEYNQ